MLQINHILLLLIFLASHMGSQIIASWLRSFYLHLRRIMNPPFHPPSVFPSANLSPFHLPHTKTCQWGPHPSSVFQEIFSLPGALISYWGTRFCICTSFPNLFIIYCTNAFIFSYLLLSSPLVTCFPFGPPATHITLGWRITFHFPPPTSSISSEYYPGHFPIPSEFVHLVLPLAQLILGLGIPLTLDLVTRLRPLFVSSILQPRAVLSLPTS
jgi:hypothetical protein